MGGFALIAWPAEYGNSGVMTFLVNHAGTVYQKDLGKRTESIASRTTLFDPDQIWKKVDVANTEKGRVCCGHFSVAWRRSAN